MGRRHGSLAVGGGMQTKPTHRRFDVLDTAIQAIEVLRPVVIRIQRLDRDLGEQLRRALSSVALNVAEGDQSQGGHRVARLSTAAGSNAEARAGLRVALAWGYVEASDVEAGEGAARSRLVLAGVREKRLEVLADQTVQNRLGRAPRSVSGGEDGHGDGHRGPVASPRGPKRRSSGFASRSRDRPALSPVTAASTGEAVDPHGDDDSRVR